MLKLFIETLLYDHCMFAKNRNVFALKTLKVQQTFPNKYSM